MTSATPGTSTVRWWEIRLASSLTVGLAGGFWGLMILFSDYPAGWSETRWMAYVLGSHAAFGLVIGVLVPRWWYLSLLAGWGAMFLGLLSMSREFLVDLLLPVLASLLAASILGAVAVRLINVARVTMCARAAR